MAADTSIGHYNLLERIGDGGLGEVYRARDTKVGRTVALKLIAPEIAADSERLQRLLSDARAAASLSHPNIAALWDIGDAGGTHYLAYEFAGGTRLRDETSGAPMNAKRALDLAIQIADGVADGHAHGIIHGDLRPDTVIVTPKGSAKILDFGMAPWTRGGALRDQAARSPDTLPLEAAALAAYLSPEQAMGGAVDARTDVFSLGTLAYELATGRNPFAAGRAADSIVNVLTGALTPPSHINPSLPRELDDVLMRAMTRDLVRRQQTAAGLASELRTVASALTVLKSDPLEGSEILPLDERPDRTSGGLLIGALVLAAAAAVGVWWLLSAS